jgi:hypothetical protein
MLLSSQFIFGNLGFPRLSALQVQVTLPAKIVYFLHKFVDQPADAALLILFLYCATFASWRARAWSGPHRDAVLLTLGVLIVLVPGVLAPTPSQLQHAYPLVPFMVLVVVYVFASAPVQPAARWTRLTGAALIIVAATDLPVNYQKLPSLLTPSHWTPMREHEVGERIRSATAPGALVLTTTPIDPIEGGLRVYPEFATGVFAWRNAAFLPPKDRERYRMISAAEHRTVPQGPDGGAAWVISEEEAEVVRRIFRMYVDGLSMRAIAIQLNREGIAFPAKATRRGPTRRGWALSTIQTMLMNEKYRGRWVWNKTMFIKEPETGKRTAVSRPRGEWIEEHRPELQIIDDALWGQVHERLKTVRSAYGATESHGRPTGQAPEVYSPYLLSGLLRCGICGARITINATRRRKPSGRVYRYAWYRCSFHTAKGPAICSNAMSIRHDVLETKLLSKFQEALTPAMIEYIVAAVNRELAAQGRGDPSGNRSPGPGTASHREGTIQPSSLCLQAATFSHPAWPKKFNVANNDSAN